MSNRSVYMIITHTSRPIKGLNTNRKGVLDDPDNWETSEKMVITDNLSRQLMTTGSIILDLIGGKVVKNRFEAKDTTVFREYVSRYQPDITAALKIWATKHPDNYNTLKKMWADEGGEDEQANPD